EVQDLARCWPIRVGDVLDPLTGPRADGSALFSPLPRGQALRVGFAEDPQRRIGDADVAPRLVASAHGYELLAPTRRALLTIDSGARRAVPRRRQLDRIREPGAGVPTARRGRARR